MCLYNIPQTLCLRLRHTDVAHQMSRIIYPTSSQSELQVGLKFSWEKVKTFLSIEIYETGQN